MNPESVPELPPVDPTLEAPRPTPFDTWRARFMFVLGFAYLLIVAGLIHRAPTQSVTLFELDVMAIGIAFLWPIFVAEAIWQVYRRDRTKPRGPVLGRTILVILMPPWRMALTDSRTGLIWLPRMGWRRPGKELFKRIELVFSGPMLLFAFLILPLLIFEYVQSEQMKSNAALALVLDIGIAVIWVAFATEFVFKASAHPKPFRFAQERWLDVAIVVLPMLEYVLTKWVDAAPLARLLRLGRAISPEQIARLQRLYRLQGLTTKAWHALLLIEGVARILGQTPEKRLAKLEEKIAELEEDLAELRKDADTVRAQIPTPVADPTEMVQNQPLAVSGGRAGEPSGEVVIASRRPSAP
jgi:hypothetical protein